MANVQNISGTTSGNYVKLDNAIIEAISEEILFQASPNFVFQQLAKIITDLTVMPGQTVKFIKYSSLSGDAALVETSPMETKAMSTSFVQISVSEHGFAIKVSELLLQTTFLKIMEHAGALLGKHYGEYRDSMVRDVLLTNTNIIFADGTGAMGNISRADLDESDVFDVNVTREAVEFLQTSKAPKFNGDAYIAVIDPHQAKTLRKDDAWVSAQLYTNPDNILTAELGRIEDVRFLVTTNTIKIPKNTQQLWADNKNTGRTTAVPANPNTTVFRSVVCGEYAVGIADCLPVHLRDNGNEDFQRWHALGYYGIWGVGLIETGHSVIIETA